MDVREDPWLAARLGCAAYRVAEETDPPAVRRRIGETPSAFYYARIATERVDRLRGLLAAGFYVVDVTVTYRWRGDPMAAGAVPVSDAGPGDGPPVLEIAATGFRFSRFHLDPLIPRQVADRIKRDWVQSYLDRARGDRLFVARLDGRPAGFLAALTADRDGARTAVIDLIAVDPRLQGRGVGTALVARFVAEYRDRCDRLEVGTQIANVPSLALYERCGFRIDRSEYVLHLHVPGG